MIKKIKATLKDALPGKMLIWYRILRSSRLRRWVFSAANDFSRAERVVLLESLYRADEAPVTKAHSFSELFTVVEHVMSIPKAKEGYIVEAGTYKGASAMKLSLVAKLTGRRLAIFDSFEGIPENDEPHKKTIYGKGSGFKKGEYCGSLEEVKKGIEKYGCLEVCEFHKGWFEKTMPDFHEPVVAAYMDVDLVSSTKTCITHLWPLCCFGGALFSQDGHLPLVLEAVSDAQFWKDEVGVDMPKIDGLWKSKLISMKKNMVTS